MAFSAYLLKNISGSREVLLRISLPDLDGADVKQVIDQVQHAGAVACDGFDEFGLFIVQVSPNPASRMSA
jgi:hypothetical protein